MRSKAISLMVICSALAACEGEQPASKPAPVATSPAAPKAATAPVAASTATGFRPITYFQQKCARCHGPYGSFYGDTFGKNITQAELRQKVHDMVFGAAQSSLSAAELDVLNAYHQSLARNAPFLVVVTGAPKASGEVSPGATIEILAGDARLSATVNDHSWTADLSAITTDATIVATLNGMRTTIPLRAGEVSDQPESDEISR